MGKTEMENKNEKQKWKAKKWMALILAEALCMAVPMQTEAAQAEPLVVTTTEQCSIWSMPATTEENRMKYVNEGYQIMVYPEVIQSGLGDGKTFYRTVKGAYVLCRCVTVGESSSASGENESGFAVVFPIMPSLPEFDNVEKIVAWELKPWMGGYLKYGYDAAGHEIRAEYLESDGTTVYKIRTTEYDPAGRWEAKVNYEPDGRIPDFMGTLWFYEYDETGNWIRTTTFEAKTGRPLEVDEYDTAGHIIMNMFFNEDGSAYQRYFNSEGKGIRSVQYNADGTVSSYHISEYDAAGNRIRSTTYHSNGTIKEDMISEYNEEGREIRRTTYDGSGAVVEVLEEDDIYITPGRTK